LKANLLPLVLVDRIGYFAWNFDTVGLDNERLSKGMTHSTNKSLSIHFVGDRNSIGHYDPRQARIDAIKAVPPARKHDDYLLRLLKSRKMSVGYCVIKVIQNFIDSHPNRKKAIFRATNGVSMMSTREKP